LKSGAEAPISRVLIKPSAPKVRLLMHAKVKTVLVKLNPDTFMRTSFENGLSYPMHYVYPKG
jgi:hypothetical protein